MKKHTQHRRRRRRIIAVFLIAVMLPGLIFAYLGFRSINQEERWQKQLVSRNLRASLRAGIGRIEQNVQSRMLAILDSLESQASDPQGFFPRRLQRFSLQNPLVSGVFVLGPNRRVMYPRGFRDRPITSNLWKSLKSESLRQHLELGEQFEARGRYNDAMDEYTRGLRELTSRHVHLALLVRIARCRSKMGDLEGAQRDYRRVIVEDRGRFYGEELPYRLIASYQLAALAEQTGRQTSAFDLLSDLYDDMLNNFDRFERSQFEFHLKKVKNGLQDLSGHVRDVARVETDSLARREDELRNEVDRRGFLLVHLLPEIARRQGTPTSGLQIVTVNPDEGVFRFAYNVSGIQNSRIKIVGLELDWQGRYS